MSDIPAPVPTELSRPFWDAAREGRLVLQKCGNCGAFRWTPQILCNVCLSEDTRWTQVSGRGTLYSYTVVHRPPLPAFQAPYVVAVVRLDEGPLMLTNIVDADPADLALEMPVEVVFQPLNAEITAYRFRPAPR
jgi:uncharacterized OB-fold protein